MPSTMLVGVFRILTDMGDRPIDQDAVDRLAKSMAEIGLQTPIAVRRCSAKAYESQEPGFSLVAGAHRLRAAEQLGWKEIECIVMEDDDRACRLWQISENLHRHELTRLQRSRLHAEWIKLVEGEEGVSVQLEQKPLGGRPEGGISKASKELGVPRLELHRSQQIDTLTPEAETKAVELGLDDNQSALLAAAKEEDAVGQVEVLKGWNAKRGVPARLNQTMNINIHLALPETAEQLREEAANILAAYKETLERDSSEGLDDLEQLLFSCLGELIETAAKTMLMLKLDTEKTKATNDTGGGHEEV